MRQHWVFLWVCVSPWAGEGKTGNVSKFYRKHNIRGGYHTQPSFQTEMPSLNKGDFSRRKKHCIHVPIRTNKHVCGIVRQSNNCYSQAGCGVMNTYITVLLSLPRGDQREQKCSKPAEPPQRENCAARITPIKPYCIADLHADRWHCQLCILHYYYLIFLFLRPPNESLQQVDFPMRVVAIQKR